MATEAQKLLAEGVLVVLKDGLPRRLIFDMEALALIEERCGSLTTYVQGLNHGMKGKLINSTLAGLEAGLRHYRTFRGEPEYTRQRVSQLMNLQDLGPYTDALDSAWEEGIPTVQEGEEGKGSGRTKRSRGKNSSAERPSATAAATVSSGA